MPTWGGGELCPVCNKSVYRAEEAPARVKGHIFHKFCFKCDACKKLLDSTTVSEHKMTLYCKNCYAKFHGPKGCGFGQGAGSLSMDSGEKFGGPRNEKKLL